MTLNEKFTAVKKEMDGELVEREVETDLVVRMLLARVHGVFLGSWGVAKSMLIRKMLERVNATLFETLLVKNSPAEQVVGPISLKALENDEFRRITTGKLPEANVGFLDEIFKSNATVLNNLLSIINERMFHNNGTPTPLPHLWTIYGASNELPVEQREELGAFYDRLAVRVVVEPVKTSGGVKTVFEHQVKRNRGQDITTNVTRIDFDEVVQAQEEVAQVEVTEPTLESLVELHSTLRKEGMDVSLRRLNEGVKLMQAGAWMRGSNQTTVEDLRVMEHIIWDDPEEERKTAHEMTIRYAGTVARKAQELRGEFEELAQEISKYISVIQEDPQSADKDAFSDVVRVSHGLKEVQGRCDQQIEQSAKQGLDVSELNDLREEITEARNSVNRDFLGVE